VDLSQQILIVSDLVVVLELAKRKGQLMQASTKIIRLDQRPPTLTAKCLEAA